MKRRLQTNVGGTGGVNEKFLCHSEEGDQDEHLIRLKSFQDSKLFSVRRIFSRNEIFENEVPQHIVCFTGDMSTYCDILGLVTTSTNFSNLHSISFSVPKEHFGKPLILIDKMLLHLKDWHVSLLTPFTLADCDEQMAVCTKRKPRDAVVAENVQNIILLTSAFMEGFCCGGGHIYTPISSTDVCKLLSVIGLDAEDISWEFVSNEHVVPRLIPLLSAVADSIGMVMCTGASNKIASVYRGCV